MHSTDRKQGTPHPRSPLVCPHLHPSPYSPLALPTFYLSPSAYAPHVFLSLSPPFHPSPYSPLALPTFYLSPSACAYLPSQPPEAMILLSARTATCATPLFRSSTLLFFCSWPYMKLYNASFRGNVKIMMDVPGSGTGVA